MTIADKLTLLASSKESIKKKLNIPNHVPFHSYHEFMERSDFTVYDLFKDGKQGVWYDPSDKSTLFQDIAGTVTVTKDGDPVALMKDKSGNGNHATQTTSASRPIYKTDGILHWLEFDGVDDVLKCNGLKWNGASFYTGYAVRELANDYGGFCFSAARNDMIFREYTGGAVHEVGRKAVYQTAPFAFKYIDLQNVKPLLGSPFVSWNRNIDSIFQSGVLPTNPIMDLGTKSGASSSDIELRLGFGGSYYGKTNTYGFIWVSDVVADIERDSTNTYLMNKSGVTL